MALAEIIDRPAPILGRLRPAARPQRTLTPAPETRKTAAPVPSLLEEMGDMLFDHVMGLN